MHRRLGRPTLMLGMAAALVALSCALCPGATTDLISVNLAGAVASGSSAWPSVSADGRLVTFSSSAADLVPDDTNGANDVFCRDRLLGTTELISVSTTGEQGNGYSTYAAITPDGRFVAFESGASNLVTHDANDAADIFVRDRTAGTTELISMTSDGEQADGRSWFPALSADGRFVAFFSEADNLRGGQHRYYSDVYVRDRLLGTTEIVSEGAPHQGGMQPSMSADGRFVAFSQHGYGSDLWELRVFLYDRLAKTTECISVNSDGGLANGYASSPSVSANGRFVAFASYASNLVPEDTNAEEDVFVRDRMLGTTERVSVGSGGEQADGACWVGAISADARFVAFGSNAPNLVPGDTNAGYDAFLRDRVTDTTERVSLSSAGEQANGGYGGAAISSHGQFVAFTSEASNLVPGDTNDAADVFLRDRGPQYLFYDVLEGYWAYEEVNACANARIVSGYGDGLYHPDYQVTRAQMAVFISRALAGGDENIPAGPRTPSFLDVPRSYWAYDHIEYAKARGIVEGYSDRLFLPDLAVNRAQMAVFVARAIADPTGEEALADYQPPDTPTFSDVATDHWAYKHIEYLAANQVVGGYPDGAYHPTETVTRDQMAVYIARGFRLPLSEAARPQLLPDPHSDLPPLDTPAFEPLYSGHSGGKGAALSPLFCAIGRAR